MKHLKKFNEGIFDLFSNSGSEEDRIAKNIINITIPKLDPEEITKVRNNIRSWTYCFNIGGSSSTISKRRSSGPSGITTSRFELKIDGDTLDCSKSLSENIFDLIKNIYNEEERRQKLQRITTNTSL
jgi:hypothetical protein